MIDLENVDKIDKILKSLNELEIKLKTKAIRSGLVAAAKPIKKDMASLAPRKTGILASSVNHQTLQKKHKDRIGIDEKDTAIFVGPNKKVNGTDVAWRAQFIEDGVRSHDITRKVTRKLGRSLKLKIGNRVLTGSVKHPGIKANPFMERSVKQNEGNVSTLFYQGMAKTLDRIRAQ